MHTRGKCGALLEFLSYTWTMLWRMRALLAASSKEVPSHPPRRIAACFTNARSISKSRGLSHPSSSPMLALQRSGGPRGILASIPESSIKLHPLRPLSHNWAHGADQTHTPHSSSYGRPARVSLVPCTYPTGWVVSSAPPAIQGCGVRVRRWKEATLGGRSGSAKWLLVSTRCHWAPEQCTV